MKTKRRGLVASNPDRHTSYETIRYVEDAVLVERTLRSDDRAYQILMERYTPIVVGFLWNRLGRKHEVEDLAQEVFFTAYRKLGQLKSIHSFDVWLIRIAKNKLNDHLRNSRRRPHLMPNPTEDDSSHLSHYPAKPSSDPVQQVTGTQTCMIIMQEIAKLGRTYQKIVYARLLGGETCEDLARRFGIREETVRVRLSRGLRKLRRRLVKRGIGELSPDFQVGEGDLGS